MPPHHVETQIFQVLVFSDEGMVRDVENFGAQGGSQAMETIRQVKMGVSPIPTTGLTVRYFTFRRSSFCAQVHQQLRSRCSTERCMLCSLSEGRYSYDFRLSGSTRPYICVEMSRQPMRDVVGITP